MDLASETFQLPSTFQFSGANVQQLAASGTTNQTLVTIVVDFSGSTQPFHGDMAKAVQEVIKACALSPRADFLMVRLVGFNNAVTEIHGFKPLSECHLGNYEAGKLPRSHGMTALFDATLSSVEATTAYAKALGTQDLEANGIVIVITDGDDNGSSQTKAAVKKAFQTALSSETLESLVSILIGLGGGPSLDAYLRAFKDEAGFTQFVSVADVTPSKLAKIAEFISKSVSAQSMSLGSGGPSQSLALSI